MAPSTLLAPLLALAAALGFAMAGVFLRRGLQYASPRAAALISVTFTAGFIWAVAAATVPLSRVLTWRVLPFLAAGLAAPGVARLVLYTGVERLGIARSSALVSSAPLFAVAMAIVFLGARPTWILLAGVLGVVAGGALLSLRTREEKRWRRRDLLLPVGAAGGFALRDILSRWGLREFPEPMIAAAAATLASVVVMWLIAAAGGREGLRPPPAGLGLMAAAGLCESAAYLTMWRALALGDVSVVSPLVHAQPFFTIVLVALFLRDLERVTWRIGLASALIVAGVAVVIRFH